VQHHVGWTCENGKHFDRGQNVPTYQWRAVPVHTTPECEAEKTCQGAGHTEECKQPGQEGPDDPERLAFSYTEANYDAVRTMIATGALDGIVAALDADWVDYAVERRAIQIQSCTGTIIANFPVSHEWAAVLEAAADLSTAIAP